MAVGKDKRRVMVTLPQFVYAELLAISEASGISASSVCSQLLTEAMPALQAMRAALQIAKTDQAQAYDKLAQLLATSQVQAGQVQLEIIEERGKIRRSPRKKGAAHEAHK